MRSVIRVVPLPVLHVPPGCLHLLLLLLFRLQDKSSPPITVPIITSIVNRSPLATAFTSAPTIQTGSPPGPSPIRISRTIRPALFRQPARLLFATAPAHNPDSPRDN